jgi:predicted TPR repeat methyltransferase
MSPSALFQSSGDMLADRRYEYARDLWAEGDVSAAVDLVVQALERAPRFAAAWFLFGEIRERLKDSAAAIDAYRQALRGSASRRCDRRCRRPTYGRCSTSMRRASTRR